MRASEDIAVFGAHIKHGSGKLTVVNSLFDGDCIASLLYGPVYRLLRRDILIEVSEEEPSGRGLDVILHGDDGGYTPLDKLWSKTEKALGIITFCTFTACQTDHSQIIHAS